jgi:hypothetical protein
MTSSSAARTAIAGAGRFGAVKPQLLSAVPRPTVTAWLAYRPELSSSSSLYMSTNSLVVPYSGDLADICSPLR